MCQEEPSPQSKVNKSVKRRTSDYAVIACILAGCAWYGDRAGGWSTEEDTASIKELFMLLGRGLGYESLAVSLGVYFVVSQCFLTGANLVWDSVITTHFPKTMPREHVIEQWKGIFPNTLLLLPLAQVLTDVLILNGLTRQSFGRSEPLTVLIDSLTWSLGFEISWYTQHRLMHEVKFLWTYGHEYHHGWRRPEHMLGFTNFAFDHLVEPFVTMSSSLLPMLLFPSNFFVAKFMAVVYMVLAVLAHWNAFPYRYHLNHHYKVTYNYGSHVPIFDMMFGTYYWEPSGEKKEE
eukprot:TRINITY_DN22363_c0_g1_i1.p1 TRINITY_DN22363_c0_g1~~TRINITY_DN22363_c0_g1_i1.p1  ORF type:complete len:291 (+),score=46.20 TRINITY_DN22363_c0_g1_i1:58-930(+)